MLEVKRPLLDEEKHPIISPFGKIRTVTIEGVTKTTIPHQGIDFRCPTGTLIRAVAPGKIVRVGWQDFKSKKIGLGFRIMQEFTSEDVKYICCYGHLSTSMVEEGVDVVEGQPIAYSGATGNVEGPHLHVQFRKLDTSVWIDAKFL